MVNLTDSVAAPRRVPPIAIRDGFLPETSAITFGIVQAGRRSLRLGRLVLITFGEPESDARGVRWPITGGLLSAAPSGQIGFRWEDGRLEAFLEGWTPALPAWLYALSQLPVHLVVTRLLLLQLRGRDPLPEPVAGQSERRAAAALDALFLLAIARLAGRRRVLWRAAGLAFLYCPAAWVLAGCTLGGALAGTRVVSVDGSRVRPGQAALRLLLAPLAALTGGAVHDARAGTAVVRR